MPAPHASTHSLSALLAVRSQLADQRLAFLGLQAKRLAERARQAASDQQYFADSTPGPVAEDVRRRYGELKGFLEQADKENAAALNEVAGRSRPISEVVVPVQIDFQDIDAARHDAEDLKQFIRDTLRAANAVTKQQSERAAVLKVLVRTGGMHSSLAEWLWSRWNAEDVPLKLFLLLPDLSPSRLRVVRDMTEIFGAERIAIATQPSGVTDGDIARTTMASAPEAHRPAVAIDKAVPVVAGASGQRWKWFAVAAVILGLGASVRWSPLLRQSLLNTTSPAGVNNDRPRTSDNGAPPPVAPSRDGPMAANSGRAVAEDRVPTAQPTTLRPGGPIRADQSRSAVQTGTGSATPRLALRITRTPTQRPGGSGELESIEGVLEGPDGARSGLCVAAYAKTTGRIWYLQPEVGPEVCRPVSSDRSWSVETRGGAMYIVLLMKSGGSTPPTFRDLAEVQGVLASASIDYK